MTAERFASVALPLPIPEPYKYRIPTAMVDRALPGARVVVPVRDREMIGIITDINGAPPTQNPKDLLILPDDYRTLPVPLLELARQAARHWGSPPGMMLRAMLPAPLWGRTRISLELTHSVPSQMGGTAGKLLEWLKRQGGKGSARSAGRHLKRPVWEVVDRLQRVGALSVEASPPDTRGAVATQRIAKLVGERLSLTQRDSRFGRAPAQRALYEALEEGGGQVAVKALLANAGVSGGPLRSLEKESLIEVIAEEISRDPFADLPATAPPTRLTVDQLRALDYLGQLGAGEAALLFGVTGSGKTAVYLERIRQLLAQSRGAILLVPEIALTPQTVARVRGAFGDQVAVLHSGLSDGERADAWRVLRSGQRMVAVGARSAVFAPVKNLGVIILDEEHEASYKNGETPRYHARDIARMRARIEGASLILGSATPALETWVRVPDRDSRIELPVRIENRPMPPVEIIDLKLVPSLAGAGLPWTKPLDQAVTSALARREQVLLLLNRRGWASFIQCVECGTTVECPDCSITLTVHRGPEHLRCHYCDHRSSVPKSCSTCGGSTIQHRGAGTQQLERLIAERFPDARTVRMDLDTTGSRWSHHRILERVAKQEVDILLGTQMIAKGIDFPNVTLVGVVDADLALHLPDFRAAERTFQLVAQVAGRTGRGPKGGRVLVQTRQPDHPALVFAAKHDAAGFLAIELENRNTPAYPPNISLARVVGSGPEQPEVIETLVKFAEWSETVIAKSKRNLLVLGPAPCPIERIRRDWRAHLLIKGDPQAVAAWVRTVGPVLSSTRGPVKLTLDHDPVSLL